MERVILLLLAVVVIAAVLYIRSLKSREKILRRDLNYYRTTYLYKQGGVSGWGNYYLVSLDAGATWYSAERENGKTVIVGPADEVFPGLLDRLEGMDALFAHVRKHGSIAIDQLGILEAAGFTVKET